MASLFDQYEQVQSTGYVTGRPVIPEMTTAGIINAKLEDDGPIFSKKRINFSLNDYVTHMNVCSNTLIIGMKNKIRKFDLSQSNNFEDIDLQKGIHEKIKIHDMFLDPTGRHILISLVRTENEAYYENIYLFSISKKQQCTKMKENIISAIAWNIKNTSENSSGTILVGTTKGLIFETEVASSDDRNFFQSSPEQYFKQVCDIGSNSIINTGSKAITGLYFQKIKNDSYFVFATTPSRLFQFTGNSTATDPPYLQNIFSCNKDLPESYIELPGTLAYSKFQLFQKNSDSLPVKFAWMTEPGVLCGNINYAAKYPENLIAANQNLILYPEEKSEHGNPLSIVLTEFHVLVLFRDRLKVMSILNEKLVFEDVFAETHGLLKGIIKNPKQGAIWAFSDMAVYYYKVVKEDRYVWEMYLDKKEYKLAREYCKGDAVKLDKVLSKEADDLFKKKRYDDSAVIYAQTYSSFEEIALKFLQAEQESALRKFLVKKLEGLKPQDKTQITMIIMWLTEIYLNELGVMRTAGKQSTNEYNTLEKEFRDLLKQQRVKDSASNNRSAVYSLMSNHGDEKNLIFFTVLMKDFEKVIQYHLQHKKYKEALNILSEHSRPELFYLFSPALMQVKPKETVDAWITQDHRLNPVNLIPSLVQYDDSSDLKQKKEAIRYLEFCVDNMNVRDQAVHNYLLTLYAHLQETEKLMTYLQRQDETNVPYDQKYALRICSEREGLEKACVHIYTTMGLYEEAVDLALKVDIDLAKQNADRPEENDELRKKLWLKIAKHVVKEKSDIKRAMEFLQECDLIKIEDILPFFPDFVTIDHFKDAICSSLQEYNQHIEGLKEEMEMATQSAYEIRTEIQTFRNKCTTVTAQEKCSACNYPIMTRSFYLFPCKHVFHSVCVIAEVLPFLHPTKKSKVEEIQRQLAALVGQEDSSSISSATLMTATISTKDKLNAELDDIVASECLYCGDTMIRSIDAPFINMEKYAEVMQSWQ